MREPRWATPRNKRLCILAVIHLSRIMHYALPIQIILDFSCDVIIFENKKITFPSEVSVPLDKRPYRTLTFHNVLARQGSFFCNRARLNFQALALRDTKVAAQEGCRVGQKMSYRFSFC